MAEPRLAGCLGLGGTGMVLRAARRSVPDERGTEVADGILIDVNQHGWVGNPADGLGERTEARRILLAATGREIAASCGRSFVASWADQLVLAIDIAAVVVSSAHHQAKEGAEDDQARD